MSAESVAQTPPPAPAPAATAAPTRSRRRWVRRFAVLLGLLGLLVWFAPTIVAKTSLRNRIAREASAGLNGTLDIGGASLGWLSPIELRDVTLTDKQGRVVARIPKVTSTRSLLALARDRDRSDLGEFALDRPAVDVVCEDGTTNLEQVIAEYLKNDDAPGPTRTPVVVTVAGGTLTLRDARTGKAGEFQNLDATVTVPAARSAPVTVNLVGNAPGRVEAEVAVGDAGRVRLVADGLALESVAPLLRRADPGLTLAGALTADLTATWGTDAAGKPAATAAGTLAVKNLALVAPWLNGDTLRLARAELPLNLSVAGKAVRVERAALATDVGTASVAGVFDPDEPLDRWFDRPGLKLDANLDLARLAAVLPKLLRVRDGTVLREGNVVVAVESKATPSGTAWAGSVNTSALKATRDGREIHWDDPLSVEFAARANPGQLPTFDRLVCRSEFVALNAQVSPDSVRAAANVYLDKLAARLAEFVNLDGITLDGEGTAWVVARRTPAGDFKADAALELKQFVFADRTGNGLREPALKFQLTAAGKAPAGGPVSVSAATLALAAGADELHLTLLEPIPDVKQLAAGKLDARLTGDLGRWRTRLTAVVRVPKHYVIGGTASAGGTVRFAPGVIAVDRLALAIDRVRFRGAGLDLDEPHMNGTADLTVDRKTGTATLDQFVVNSAPLSATKAKLVIEAPDRGDLVVHGGGAVTTDLNRLGKTLKLYADPRGPDSLHGRGSGGIRFRHAGDVTTFGGALFFTNFAVGSPVSPDWSEPTLRLDVDGSYTESADAVAFKTAKAERPGLLLDAAGTMGKFDTTQDVDFTGNLTCDLAKLSPKLRGLLGGGFAAAGKSTKPVSVRGSLNPPPKPGAKAPPGALAALTAAAGLGWESLKAYGFDVGPGELRMTLADGVARTNPVIATFGGGKVTVQPTVRLDPGPSELTLAKGLIVDRAKLTPAACASALGYALPAIAHASKAEGEVSVNLGDNRIPLSDPTKATLEAHVVVHKATLTPGPVITQIARILEVQSPTMTLADNTTVAVWVKNGRVHHQNLAVKLGGYFVQTGGSVGLDDDTLDLVADVPIPGGLPFLKDRPAIAKALSGKRVRVPIKGTLDRPALDPAALNAAVADLAREVAKSAGKDLFGGELDKLPGAKLLPKGGLFPFPFPKK